MKLVIRKSRYPSHDALANLTFDREFFSEEDLLEISRVGEERYRGFIIHKNTAAALYEALGEVFEPKKDTPKEDAPIEPIKEELEKEVPLTKLTVDELKAIAVTKGIKVSGLKKADLIKAIEG